MKENEIINEEKKDLRPIWIYLFLTVGLTVLLAIIIKIIFPSFDAESQADVLAFIISAINFIIFIVLYHKRLIKDAKRITGKRFLQIVITGLIIVAVNYVITTIIEKTGAPMTNQDTILDSLSRHKILMSINVCLFAPVIEELIFRYSFGTFIKKEVVYIIISSIVFGLLHGIGIVTTVYVLIGVALALVYLKNDKNIVASTIVHFMNNAISLIMTIL